MARASTRSSPGAVACVCFRTERAARLHAHEPSGVTSGVPPLRELGALE